MDTTKNTSTVGYERVSADSITDLGVSVDFFASVVAKKLAQQLQSGRDVLTTFVDEKSVSDTNYVGLQEAIQILGLPLEYRIVFAKRDVEEDIAALYGINCIKDDNDNIIATFSHGPDLQNFMPFSQHEFIARTSDRYVDLTFRLPLTDELVRYLPEIESRYENIKCFRDAYKKGMSPLDL